MKSILKIARTELKTLFYSPIAWLVLIVYSIQTSLDYLDLLNGMQMSAAVGAKIPGVTNSIFAVQWGVFSIVQGRLYLYLPLLTMGLIGREISSGSIKLLLSSPITIGEIVLGKFVAIMTYCLMLVGILGIFVLTTLIYLPHADIGLMLSGMLGIFLMIMVYASIGLFMSALSGYQPVAALFTFAVLAFLNFIGSIGQNLDGVRKLASFLAINGRTDQLVQGLISTRELAYFFIMSILFLGFAMIKLRFERYSRPWGIRMLNYVSLGVIAIFINYLASLPALTAYFDVTQIQSQTISEGSQKILGNMPQVHVHTYVNVLEDNAAFGLPEARNADHTFYDRYQRFLQKDILVDYTYYYDSLEPKAFLYIQHPGASLKDLAENFADAKGVDMNLILDSAAIRKVIDLRPWKNRFMRRFEIGGKATMLGLFRDQKVVPGEEEMMDAFKLMNVPKQHVAFLTGHNERVAEEGGTRDRDYNERMNNSQQRQSVVNHGFDFREIRIDSNDIPEDISLMIIADPMLPLRPAEVAKIQAYVASGRDLWINGEPARRELINPLINPLGIRFREGMLLENSGDPNFAPDFLITYFAPQAARYSKVLKQLVDDSARLTTNGAAALIYDSTGPFMIQPFIVTDGSTTWNHVGPYDTTAISAKYDPGHGDQKGVYPIAVTLERTIRGRQQRIMVCGDADMLSDGEFSGVPKKLWELNKEIFKWFSHGEFPMDIYHPSEPDVRVTIGVGGISALKVILIFLLPGLLLAAGGGILIVRNRR